MLIWCTLRQSKWIVLFVKQIMDNLILWVRYFHCFLECSGKLPFIFWRVRKDYVYDHAQTICRGSLPGEKQLEMLIYGGQCALYSGMQLCSLFCVTLRIGRGRAWERNWMYEIYQQQSDGYQRIEGRLSKIKHVLSFPFFFLLIFPEIPKPTATNGSGRGGRKGNNGEYILSMHLM